MNIVRHTEKKKYNSKVNYCRECRTKREDRKEKTIDVAKKGAKAASVVVIAPAIKVIQKDGAKLAEQVSHKAVNVAAEVIKKKKL